MRAVICTRDSTKVLKASLSLPAVERPPIGDTIGDTEGEFVGVEPGDMFGVGFQILSR